MRVRRAGKGCGCLLVVLAGLGLTAWFGLYSFLAREAPVRAEMLVIEGWVGDELLAQAVDWAERNGVKKIVATGGPVEVGSYLVPWKTFAEMTKARLEALGLGDRFELVAVPSEKVRRGRTRESARALKAATGMERGAFNLASEGPHTRRSWRAFQEVFGDGVEVGSVALVPVAYGERDWWSCSEGVRAVVDETVAYGVDVVAGAGGN